MTKTIDEIFPVDSYARWEIYDQASDNYHLVKDTQIGEWYEILEVVKCDHEQDESGECREPWKEEEHEVLVEFVSEDGGDVFSKNLGECK